MNKSILLSFLFLLVACKYPKPIEKYSGKGYIVTRIHPISNRVQLKNSDSVFTVYLTDFDTKNLRVGDTIK